MLLLLIWWMYVAVVSEWVTHPSHGIETLSSARFTLISGTLLTLKDTDGNISEHVDAPPIWPYQGLIHPLCLRHCTVACSLHCHEQHSLMRGGSVIDVLRVVHNFCLRVISVGSTGRIIEQDQSSSAEKSCHIVP